MDRAVDPLSVAGSRRERVGLSMTLMDTALADSALAARLRDEFGWKRRLHSLDCVVEVSTGEVASVRFAGTRYATSARPKATDVGLERRVTDALSATAHVHTSSPETRITVHARAGVVTLGGHVGAGYERDAAIRVTEALFGVTRVRSRISVRRKTPRQLVGSVR